MQFTTRTLLLLVSATVLGGCVSVSYGVKPRTDRLEQLTPGQSRGGDVLLALGEPRGKGGAHVSPDIPLRDVWYYELVKSSSSVLAHNTTVDLTMLVVFMKGDVYDGYLWFSHVEQMGRNGTRSPK